MGRGFACSVLAAVLVVSAAGALLYASALSTPAPIKIWEAYARHWVTITQVNLSYSRGGFDVTLPVGYRVDVSAMAPASVEIDEPGMLMSPSPAQFAIDPRDPTTQDGALTPATIPPGGSVTYSYADEWMQGFLPAPPWWCTERFQYTRDKVGIVLGGEILPRALQDIIANPYHDSNAKNTQEDVWAYLRQHPTLVVGKTPLWSEIPNTAGQIIPVTVDVTNIAVKDTADGITADVDAHGALVSDRIPAGWSVVSGSYSITPTSTTGNPDGSKTVTWTLDIPGADVTGKTDLSTPTPYHGVKLRYQLETPKLGAGRIELPRAEVDTNADGAVDAHSEIPVVDVFRVNIRPTALLGGPYSGVEGTPIQFDASASSDPDGDALQFRWDYQSDGTWDTGWSSSPISPAVTFGDDTSGTVTVEVSDGELTALATAAYVIANAPPRIDSVKVTGADEGSPASITVEFSDPGWLDTFTAFVDWGFGMMETIPLQSSHDPPAAKGTFTLTHTYGDNFLYTPKLVIVDDDGGSVVQQLSVPVTNVAPIVSPADIHVFVEAQACLRVAGASWNTVRLDVFADNVLAGSASVTRAPGSPNDQTQCVVVEVDLLVSRAFRADVTFVPAPGAKSGSDSVWILIQPMRAPNTPGHALLKMHHVFHVGDPTTYTWTVSLSGLAAKLIGGCGCSGHDDEDEHDDGDHAHEDCGDDESNSDASCGDDDDGSSVGSDASGDHASAGLVRNGGVPNTGKDRECGDDSEEGCEEHDDCDVNHDAHDETGDHQDDENCAGVAIHFRVTARDPGSDDLTFTWDFGDKTILTHIYYNNGVSPDPLPSPGGVFPFVITDTAVHSMKNPCGKTIHLVVNDDDGGVTPLTFTIRP